MKQRCHCGAVQVDVDSDQVIIWCRKCDWRYTYKGVPKPLVRAVQQLYALLQNRKGEETRV